MANGSSKNDERNIGDELMQHERELVALFEALPEESSILVGGAATDLLVHEKLVRKHGDFDVLAKESQRQSIIEALDKKYEVSEENERLVFKLADGTEAHIVFLAQQEDGIHSIGVNNHEIIFSDDLFSGVTVETHSGAVPLVTPEIMMQTLNLHVAGIEPREKDIKAKELIRDKYFPGEDVDSSRFLPKVVPVS